VSQNWVCRRAPPGELKQQRLGWAVVLWQDNSGDGHEERGLRDMDMAEFMFAKTDWEAPREERAYFDKERREGMFSDTELMTEEVDGDGSDCRGEGASFNLATQDIFAVEAGLVYSVILG
jgi:hypothetical protein